MHHPAAAMKPQTLTGLLLPQPYPQNTRAGLQYTFAMRMPEWGVFARHQLTHGERRKKMKREAHSITGLDYIALYFHRPLSNTIQVPITRGHMEVGHRLELILLPLTKVWWMTRSVLGSTRGSTLRQNVRTINVFVRLLTGQFGIVKQTLQLMVGEIQM